MTKRVLSVLLALCLVIGALPLAALADEPGMTENDELFAGYVERLFYGSIMEDAGISTYADAAHNAGSRLSGNYLKLYNGLKAEILKIAKGQRESTAITVTGVPYSERIIEPVVKALLSDCPYELFWFDKAWSYGGNNSSTHVNFRVAAAYSKTGAAGTFAVNTSKISSVQTAVNNAKKVVAGAAGLSDYEKLVAYKKYICDAVTYDDNAAIYGPYNVGIDPWQLVYVFDGNPRTNVVCEGYSKAFQYLCDLTSFRDKTIQCYSVTGTVNGGGHMWNIVTIGKENYLVDVTNCDDNSVGFPDRLFLVGYTSGTVQTGYTIATGGYGDLNVKYIYYADQSSILGNGVLKLSSKKYDPSTAPVPVAGFYDVFSDDYYADAVAWAVENNITNGTSATAFSPSRECTRGQIVTFLWRAAGSPPPTTTDNPFHDVASGAYYSDAVLWAVENSITNGTSATTFSPDAPCTRGQSMTFLWRAAGSPPPTTTVSPFKDVTSNVFYSDAVLWAVESQITNGTSATAFSPSRECTRGQIVTFLYRWKINT